MRSEDTVRQTIRKSSNISMEKKPAEVRRNFIIPIVIKAA